MHSLDFLIGNSSIEKYCSWLLMIGLLLNIKSAFQRDSKGGTGYLILFFVMLIYSVFYTPDTGDNYASMTSYYAYLNGSDWEKLHFERIYFDIMDLIPYGYFYYRLAVWGAACLLCVWLLKEMKIKSSVATLSVLTFALPLLLYYQRAAFAYVLLYVALYCYVSKGNMLDTIPFLSKKYRLISVGLLLCAVPFHTTMPVYIFILLCAVFIPKNRIGIFITIIILVIFSTSIISNSISMLSFFQEETIETGLRSLENDTGIIGQNSIGYIAYFLHWLPVYCMVIYGLYKIMQISNHQTEFEKICLLNTFFLLFISVVFMSYSFTIQIKFRNAAMMPWTLYLASYYTRNSGSSVCSVYAISTIMTSIL